MNKLFRGWLFASGLGVGVVGAQEAEESAPQPHTCEAQALASRDGEYAFYPSGREGPLADILTEDLKWMHGPGGVLEKLGLLEGIGHHTIEFMSGRALNALSANNRYPVGTWMDGANIYNALNRGSGVLYEFVLGGRDFQHSYYRSDVPRVLQLSIIAHVAGHNYFTVHSAFPHKSSSNRVGESGDIDDLIQAATADVGEEAVQRWYQLLSSLRWAQDVINLHYQTPADLAPNDQFDRVNYHSGAKVSGGRKPWTSTANILQAFVANLPPNLPAWQREMAERMERIERYIPGAVNTKLVNEGFAQIVQEIVFHHHPDELATFESGKEIHDLEGPVSYPSLENPYYFGRELWRGIRDDFYARPDIVALKAQYPDPKAYAMERDRRFIAYAGKEIIGNRNYASNDRFVKAFLKDSWIRQHQYGLLRKVDQEEAWELMEQGKVPRPDYSRMQDPQLLQVMTHHPERIRDYIIRKYEDFRWSFPQVRIREMHHANGAIRLGLDDDIGNLLPMHPGSFVKTAYVYSQIMNRPIEIEANLLGNQANSNWLEQYVVYKVRLTMRPDAHFELQTLSRQFVARGYGLVNTTAEEADVAANAAQIFNAEMTARFKAWIEQYRADQFLGLSVDPENDAGRLQPLPKHPYTVQMNRQDVQHGMAQVINQATQAEVHTLLPGAVRALGAFSRVFKTRAHEALLRGWATGGLAQSKSGVKVTVLPEIPSFSFSNIGEKFKQILAPFEGQEGNPYWQDDVYNLYPVHLPDLSYVWVDAQKGKGGEGEGEEGEEQDEGDGEPTEGEPGEGEESKPGTGKGESGGVREVEIPIDLYRKIIGNYVELPNLRPLDSNSPRFKYVPAGWHKKPMGRLHVKETTDKIVELGIGEIERRREAGEEVDDLDPIDIGTELLTPQDIRVHSHSREKVPDMNAQVTIAADMSASMSHKIAKMKSLVFDLEALLLNRYKKVEFRFVVFDTDAVVMKTSDEFFRSDMGGGTDYAKGFEHVLKVQQDFPESQWDRFVVGFGDLEDSLTPDLRQKLQQVMAQSRYVGMVHMGMAGGGWMPDIFNFMKEFSEKEKFFGFVSDGDPDGDNTIKLFRRLFKNKEKTSKP